MLKVSKDEFIGLMEGLIEAISDIGAEAADEAGEPVDAIGTFYKSLGDNAPDLACFKCSDYPRFHVDADGNFLIPVDDDEAK